MSARSSARICFRRSGRRAAVARPRNRPFPTAAAAAATESNSHDSDSQRHWGSWSKEIAKKAPPDAGLFFLTRTEYCGLRTRADQVQTRIARGAKASRVLGPQS